MNKERWLGLLVQLQIEREQANFNKLEKASESHRAYHTQTHINACLAHLADCSISLEHRCAKAFVDRP